MVLIGFCLFSCPNRQFFDNFSGAKIYRFYFANTSSDSVIRWFESSYPSHRYHILYKIEQIKYNIWFLLYVTSFTLPQIGERNGEIFRIEFCFLPRCSACFARICGLFCFIFTFSKKRFGETFVSKLPFQLLLAEIPPSSACTPLTLSCRSKNAPPRCLQLR